MPRFEVNTYLNKGIYISSIVPFASPAQRFRAKVRVRVSVKAKNSPDTFIISKNIILNKGQIIDD